MNNSTVTVSPATLSANGTATSVITVQLKDSSGQNFTTAVNGALTFDAPALGTIGTATNNSQGRWTATYTAGIVAGTTVIKAHFNGGTIAASAVITLLPNGFSEPAWFTSAWDVPTTADIAPSCSSARPLTSLPIDMTQTTATPRGWMQPGIHTTPVPFVRFVTPPANGAVDEQGRLLASKRLDVFAPVTATITGGKSVEANGYTEYGVAIHVCGTKWLIIDHIDGLSAKLASALNAATTGGRAVCTTAADGSKTCVFDGLNVAVTSAEKLGRSSGRTYGIDFGGVDGPSLSAQRLHPKAWPAAYDAAVCPVEWYNAPFNQSIYSAMQTDAGCGDIAFDVAGSASGVWTSSGNMNAPLANEESAVALVSDYQLASQRVFSIGAQANIPGVSSKFYYFSPETGTTHNTPFASVRPGDVICYDQLRARGPGENDSPLSLKIFLRMTAGSTETLQIGSGTGFCGTAPYTMPSQTATFSRLTTSP